MQAAIGVRREERAAAALSAAMFFFVMASCASARPLRDEIGLAFGEQRLHWLVLGSLPVVLGATALFSWLVSRMSRRMLVAVVYRVCALVVLAFLGATLALGASSRFIEPVFFVWVGAFNLFVVSLFWAVMADVFDAERCRRLFGPIAAGGTMGVLVGAASAGVMATVAGRASVFVVCACALEAAVWVHGSLERSMRRTNGHGGLSGAETPEPWQGPRPVNDLSVAPPDGESFVAAAAAGLRRLLASRYLMGIGVFVFLTSMTAMLLYLVQAQIVANAVEGREARASLFAWMEVLAACLTLIGQLWLSRRLLERWGTGPTLTVVPLLTVAGFSMLLIAPTILPLVVFQSLRRAGNQAIMRPARETLFAAVSRAEKYQAKSVIDTLVYRGGDACGALLFAAILLVAGRDGWLTPVVVVVAAAGALWCAVALRLGVARDGSRDAHASTASGAPPARADS
jgi:AAA family ATP:ADP antiporter